MGKFWQTGSCFLAVVALAACNDSTPLRSASEAAAEDAQQQELNQYRKPDDAGAKSAPKSDAADTSDKSADDSAADPSGFDRESAKVVLARSQRKAVGCPAAAHDAKIVGEADIEVDFDGPSGRIVDVKLAAPFTNGSRDGQDCLRNAFLGEIIPNFTGTKALAYTLKVPAPADDSAKPGGKKKKK